MSSVHSPKPTPSHGFPISGMAPQSTSHWVGPRCCPHPFSPSSSAFTACEVPGSVLPALPSLRPHTRPSSDLILSHLNHGPSFLPISINPLYCLFGGLVQSLQLPLSLSVFKWCEFVLSKDASVMLKLSYILTMFWFHECLFTLQKFTQLILKIFPFICKLHLN